MWVLRLEEWVVWACRSMCWRGEKSTKRPMVERTRRVRYNGQNVQQFTNRSWSAPSKWRVYGGGFDAVVSRCRDGMVLQQ